MKHERKTVLNNPRLPADGKFKKVADELEIPISWKCTNKPLAMDWQDGN